MRYGYSKYKFEQFHKEPNVDASFPSLFQDFSLQDRESDSHCHELLKFNQ